MFEFRYSIRTILGTVIVLMGVLGLVLALISGSVHRNLAFDNQRDALRELIHLKVDDLFLDLKDRSQELGLALQSTTDFRRALRTNDIQTLNELLNTQFHQYFVTAGIVKLEQLTILDKNYNVIVEASQGKINWQTKQGVCPRLLKQARARSKRQRMKVLQDLCRVDNRPYYTILLPIGGLRLKGYLILTVDPSYSLIQTEKALGMPLRLSMTDNQVAYQSSNWPQDALHNAFIVEYVVNNSAGDPVLSVEMARDLAPFSGKLQQTRVSVMLVASIITLLAVLLAIWIMHKTTMKPLSRLTEGLHKIYKDREHMGQQLEVSGTNEMRDLTTGFNEMSIELGNLYKSLEHMAYTDELTKLPNRHLFHERLEAITSASKRSEEGFTLFLLDLDRFKSVNDTLGHHIGDKLLQEVSLRLHNTLRDDDVVTRLDQESINEFEGDVVARLGGDEFAAIFPGICDEENARVIARKLLRAMEKPFLVGEHRLVIGVSIGIVMFPKHGDDMHTLMRRADVAMYYAKNVRCGFAFYETEQDVNNLRHLNLEQDLQSAINNDLLELYYQPKICLSDGMVCGAEALARWNHPDYGMIPPDEFIQLAERTGLIHLLTDWVLHKALEQCSAWQNAGHPEGVAVNLSALNLHDTRITIIVDEALDKWSVSPEKLVLELTESAIMSDPRRSSLVLSELDEMGVNLSIDDFGTGYSTLTYVKELPVDELKIDRSFVQGIGQDNKKDEAIVRAVLTLAHHMNLSVVAEGVEDEKTMQQLKALGCDIVQGYFIARPMPFDQYLLWLRNRIVKSVNRVAGHGA